ncbi:uncharacterized protein LOC116154070 isoform X3 [Camelus dromedarius]|uniref:uncharacterized protein LOC116154070 isoform X3 n=1 Tax=Camelus dromedarius TaxID=9838 RepID=UPI003119D2B0
MGDDRKHPVTSERKWKKQVLLMEQNKPLNSNFLARAGARAESGSDDSDGSVCRPALPPAALEGGTCATLTVIRATLARLTVPEGKIQLRTNTKCCWVNATEAQSGA